MLSSQNNDLIFFCCPNTLFPNCHKTLKKKWALLKRRKDTCGFYIDYFSRLLKPQSCFDEELISNCCNDIIWMFGLLLNFSYADILPLFHRISQHTPHRWMLPVQGIGCLSSNPHPSWRHRIHWSEVHCFLTLNWDTIPRRGPAMGLPTDQSHHLLPGCFLRLRV